MWEQRYGLLRPVRTATNIRTYCDSDLRRLLNVATLCSRGYRISKIAQLSEQEICQAVINCHEDANNYCQRVNGLLASMLAMDEPQLNDILNQSIHQLGFEAAMLHVIYPFLQRIGVMWQAGTVNPAQEHLVTNLVRQKMMSAIDALCPVQPSVAYRWVLFLPEGEMHELALLFMSYALRFRGHHVLYLGQNLPIAELEAVCESYQPYALCTVLTAVPERDRVQEFVDQLASFCPSKELSLYGPLAHVEGLQLPANATRFRLMTDFLAKIDQLQPAQLPA